MDRKRTTTYLLLSGAGALLVFAALFAPHRPHTPPPPPPEPIVQVPKNPGQRPQVDVVFVLDTTGSMSALLSGAKKKIWEIARFIAQGQPAPDLRVGLIGYRDIGDEYVTKFFDLSDDLDAVYQNLSSFNAAGGGDTPEHVAKALHEALTRSSWSASKNTLRIIYLVGDAPPHEDYKDVPSWRALAQQAAERGIRINTVRCGLDEETRRVWTEIAQRARGEFASIDQSGGMMDTATPYDEELARLNRRLTETAFGYGAGRAAVRAKAVEAAAAPAAVQAERASWFGLAGSRGKAAAVSGEGDLVDDVVNKGVKVQAIAPAALPEPMQAMSPEEREKFVAEKARERKEILSQIGEVAKKRDGYLRAAKPAAPGSFDGKVRESLRKQAADIGVAY